MTQVLIKGCDVIKTGVNANTKKEWTLFRISIEPITFQGLQFDSFSSFDAKTPGVADVNLEIRVNGKFNNLTEVAPKSKVAQKLDEHDKRIASLEAAFKGLKFPQQMTKVSKEDAEDEAPDWL